LLRFLEAGDAPVYIGFGSMTSGDMHELAQVVLESLRRLGLRAILAKGWGGVKLSGMPESGSQSIYLADYIPHSWLFERCRAVVHHGGAGTTAAGLYAGKPTLVVPFGGAQPFWAEQIYRHALGPKPVPRSQLTVQKLTRALRQLVGNPAYTENAQYASRHLRLENGQMRAADLIEEGVKSFSKELAAAVAERRQWRLRRS